MSYHSDRFLRMKLALQSKNASCVNIYLYLSIPVLIMSTKFLCRCEPGSMRDPYIVLLKYLTSNCNDFFHYFPVPLFLIYFVVFTPFDTGLRSFIKYFFMKIFFLLFSEHVLLLLMDKVFTRQNVNLF